MLNITVGDVLKATGGTLLCGKENTAITDVVYDSRSVTENALFVPIVGATVDGHKFIDQCFADGASAAFTQYDRTAPNGKALIKVDNTLTALQALSAWYRSLFPVTIIGVTGSVGKTSTKEMIAAALSKGLNVMKTKGNKNSQIGMPSTMFELSKENEAAVIEMGMSEFGEMERLCAVARPKYAVMTNIGKAHIENLKTQENIRSEKFKITNYFTEDSILFLNGEDPLLWELHNKQAFKTVTFGFSERCDYYAENITVNGLQTDFTVCYDNGKKYSLTIPALGKHNVLNSLAAVAVGRALGLSLDCISEGLKTYKNAPMRQQIHQLNDMILIDDSYNASPEAMKVSLDVLKSVAKGKSIAVLADMLELGAVSETEHFNVGVHLAKNGIDNLITVGTQAKFIADGACSVNSNITVFRTENNEQAAEILRTLLTPNCAVLVKGSRGMHTDHIVQKLLQEYLCN